jgi:hypothetical protein
MIGELRVSGRSDRQIFRFLGESSYAENLIWRGFSRDGIGFANCRAAGAIAIIENQSLYRELKNILVVYHILCYA